MPLEGDSAALELLSALESSCDEHGTVGSNSRCSEEVASEEVAILLQGTAHAAVNPAPADQDVGSSRPCAPEPSCLDDQPLEAILLEIALGHGLKSSRSWFSVLSRDILVC